MPINSARIIFSFRCVRKKRSSCQRVRRDPSPPHPPSSMLDPGWHARLCKDERFFRNGHSPPTNLKLNIDPWGRGGGFTTTRRQMSVFFARTGPATLECFLCHKPPEDPPQVGVRRLHGRGLLLSKKPGKPCVEQVGHGQRQRTQAQHGQTLQPRKIRRRRAQSNIFTRLAAEQSHETGAAPVLACTCARPPRSTK